MSRRRVLAGAAGLAVVPVLAGIAPASAAPVVPAPVPTPAPTTAPPAALAKLQKGRAAKGAHGVGDPRGSDIAMQAGPRPGGPLRADVQAAAGVQPAGRPAHRTGGEDERRQGAAERRQGQRRRLRQRDHAGRLHLLRPVRRPRHDAGQDAADAAEAGRPGDGQLRHAEVRPRQRVREGAHRQPGALRPGQARLPAGQPARRAVRPAPRRRRRRLPRRPAQRREPDRRAAARGLPAHAQQAAGRRQDLRAGPAAAALDLPVPDRQRLPAADRRPGRRHQPDPPPGRPGRSSSRAGSTSPATSTSPTCRWSTPAPRTASGTA